MGEKHKGGIVDPDKLKRINIDGGLYMTQEQSDKLTKIPLNEKVVNTLTAEIKIPPENIEKFKENIKSLLNNLAENVVVDVKKKNE